MTFIHCSRAKERAFVCANHIDRKPLQLGVSL
jgi:hypothetical protein